MATNMPPHNLVEVVSAARHLIAHPDAGLDDLMRFVPGPDLPTGGKIVGLDGIREAYETGRGTFRTRATARVENVTPRRKGIVVTELPLGRRARSGSRRRSPSWCGARSCRASPRSTTTPTAARACGWSSRSRTASTRRRSSSSSTGSRRSRTRSASTTSRWSTGSRARWGSRSCSRSTSRTGSTSYDGAACTAAARREDRLHLVDGLLVAILDIDEVIAVIRTSDDTAAARERLMTVFDLHRDPDQLHPRDAAAPADEVLPDRAGGRAGDAARRRSRRSPRSSSPTALLRKTVSDELGRGRQAVRHPAAHRAARVGRARRRTTAVPLEVTDDPCWVLLSSTGLLARTLDRRAAARRRGREPSTTCSCPRCAPRPAARSRRSPPPAGWCGSACSTCRPLPATGQAPNLSGGAPVSEFLVAGPGRAGARA